MDQTEKKRVSARKYHAKMAAESPAWYIGRNIKQKYRISLAEYQEIVSVPCEICGTEEKRRVLDHCHDSGHIRGALCTGCNTKVDWYLQHKEPLKQWEETVFGRIWIALEKYENLVKLATLGQTASDTLASLRGRVEELKEELRLARDRTDREQMRADSSLHSMVRNNTGVDVPAGPISPSTADVDPFAEDPTVAEEIREEIRKHGTVHVLDQTKVG